MKKTHYIKRSLMKTQYFIYAVSEVGSLSFAFYLGVLSGQGLIPIHGRVVWLDPPLVLSESFQDAHLFESKSEAEALMVRLVKAFGDKYNFSIHENLVFVMYADLGVIPSGIIHGTPG